MPYDRPNTTMAEFPLCPRCRAEYEDPHDRRFHAQLLACPVCGPQLSFISLLERTPHEHISGDAALAACVAALRRGEIVAVKGIGGYHLMCDALNAAAIARLRASKHRPHKPLALMFPWQGADGLQRVREELQLDAVTQSALCDVSRPIVLIPRRTDSTLPDSIAPGLQEIGVMLPYSPLHHLLLESFGQPLVATSGNVSGEPVLTGNAEAKVRLGKVAQCFLHHNRPIARPADDSVLPLTQALLKLGGLRFMRDPTRGGLATVAHEIAHATGLTVRLHEPHIPVRDQVRAVCEILGYDPMFLACEGRVVAVVEAAQAKAALAAWCALPGGEQAALIGHVEPGGAQVVLETELGGERLLEELEDEPLPRIC